MHLNVKVFHKHIVNRRLMPQFIFLFKKLLCLYTVEFCNQWASWSSSCDELKNFAANNFLKLVCKLRTRICASIGYSRTASRALKEEIVTTEQVQLSIGVRV